jgi:hypothetical protein
MDWEYLILENKGPGSWIVSGPPDDEPDVFDVPSEEDFPNAADALNACGRERWELIHVEHDAGVFYFKRERALRDEVPEVEVSEKPWAPMRRR